MDETVLPVGCQPSTRVRGATSISKGSHNSMAWHQLKSDPTNKVTLFANMLYLCCCKDRLGAWTTCQPCNSTWQATAPQIPMCRHGSCTWTPVTAPAPTCSRFPHRAASYRGSTQNLHSCQAARGPWRSCSAAPGRGCGRLSSSHPSWPTAADCLPPLAAHTPTPTAHSQGCQCHWHDHGRPRCLAVMVRYTAAPHVPIIRPQIVICLYGFPHHAARP